MQRAAFVLLALSSSTALADPPGETPPAAEPAERMLGVGYKMGNGIGFFGGDVIINPAPHLSLDLYGTYVSLAASNGETGTGYAVAPAIQGHLREGQQSGPYAAVGMQYVHLALGDVVGSGTGVFANLGYEWKWRGGLGIQLGGGVQYLSKVEATNGSTTVMDGGKVNPNLEFGIRYMFL